MIFLKPISIEHARGKKVTFLISLPRGATNLSYEEAIKVKTVNNVGVKCIIDMSGS